MCIAILKTKKGIITDDELRVSFRNNNDGAGIAYTVNNQLIIEKGIFDEDQFVKAVREAEKRCDNNMLIHCRIGTSGTRNEYNTHPFLINKTVCLIHNGILDIDVPKNSKENDTQLFIEKYLSNIDTKVLMHNKTVHKLIKNIIGDSNKFVLLDNKGYYKIINEKAGHWKNNVWFSNETYKTERFAYKGFGYSSYDYCNYEYEYDKSAYDKAYNKYLLDDRFSYWDMEDCIFNLKEEQLLEIGEHPIYCLETDEIISVKDWQTNEYGYQAFTCKQLSQISPNLYDEYLELYWETLEVVEERERSKDGNNVCSLNG